MARLAKDNDEILAEQVCFHAQQACEKALKAVLLLKNMEFPLVHDIEALLEIAKEGGLRLPKRVQEAGSLSPYAVEARYPGYEEEIASTDVDEAIKLAEAVVIWASLTIGSTRRKK